MRWFGRNKKETPEVYYFCKNILGYKPRRIELYHTALMHKSLAAVEDGHKVNNERLEYLGDAILGAIVADYLYKRYPFKGEGFLTELRSKIVSRASLNELSRKLGLLDLVEYQRGRGGGFKSIGGDAFEALVGAIYLDRGYRFTRRLLTKRILNVHINVAEVASTEWNYKSKLIDWAQKNHRKVKFEVVHTSVEGRERRKLYECRVSIDGQPQQSASDFSIKAAEQMAAEQTYKALNIQ